MICQCMHTLGLDYISISVLLYITYALLSIHTYKKKKKFTIPQNFILKDRIDPKLWFSSKFSLVSLYLCLCSLIYHHTKFYLIGLYRYRDMIQSVCWGERSDFFFLSSFFTSACILKQKKQIFIKISEIKI